MRKKIMTTNKKNPDMSGVGISNTTISKVVKPGNTPETNDKFFNGKPVFISKLFLDVNNTIPCARFYVDSIGDLHMTTKIGESTIYIPETSDTNLGYEFSNSPIENGLISVTDTEKGTTTRAPRIKIADNATEVCEMSLGNWRNYISKVEGIDNLVIGKRIYYDKTTNQRKDKDNGNTIYATILVCIGDKQETINKLKAIFKNFPKVIVEWL